VRAPIGSVPGAQKKLRWSNSVYKIYETRYIFQTHVGPILIHVNPYTDVGNPITLSSTAEAAKNSSQLMRVAEEAIRSVSTQCTLSCRTLIVLSWVFIVER
jgi:hypothetical protein